MSRVWRARSLSFEIGPRTLLMGVLNTTPDSFSDGGDFIDPAAALRHAREMVAEGADILDVGGESTRPGSAVVSAHEESARVLPVVTAIAVDCPHAAISIDTYKAQVARAALDAGAHIVNDVWGFQKDPEMARVAADFQAGAVLMHNRLAEDPAADMVAEVIGFLCRSVEIALGAGLAEDRIALDPGVGFGKTHRQSMELIARLGDIAALGFPVLLGASRKRFVGQATGVSEPRARLHGTLAAHLAGVHAGANIVRAHDVRPHREALDMTDAIRSTCS